MNTIYSVRHLHIWTTRPLCRDYSCPSRSLIRFKRKLESVQTANCRAITREIARQKGPRARGVRCSDGSEALRNPVRYSRNRRRLQCRATVCQVTISREPSSNPPSDYCDLYPYGGAPYNQWDD